MNATEATKLCQFIAELCPSQKFTARTGMVWSTVLYDVPADQAEAAVIRVYREHGDDRQWNRTIEADDILREVKRRRADTIGDKLAELTPPEHTRDDVDAYVQWIRAAARDIGDGREPVQGELTQRVSRPLELTALRTLDPDPHPE